MVFLLIPLQEIKKLQCHSGWNHPFQHGQAASKIRRECFLDNFAHEIVSTVQLYSFVQIKAVFLFC